jgi:hypothetical protein
MDRRRAPGWPRPLPYLDAGVLGVQRHTSAIPHGGTRFVQASSIRCNNTLARDLPPFIHALLLAITVSAIVGWALTQLIPQQCEATMSLRTIFEQRLADAERAFEQLVTLPEYDPRGDVDELRRVVALRREELALLRKLRPES